MDARRLKPLPTSKLFSTFCVNVKMQYTLNQRLFLVKQYWITNSITATQRAYQREFGVRNPPKRNTILGLVNKLETTGSLTVNTAEYRLIFMEPVATEISGFDNADFFLWGYLKARVYATRPQTLDDLKHNITQEIQTIDNRVLQRVASNMERRSLMLADNEFQCLGRAIVKEDEYEEVRWDGIVSIVSWRGRVFKLWWEERNYGAVCGDEIDRIFVLYRMYQKVRSIVKDMLT
ncbi:hypothetical protein ANN_07008 [Periplaneta americana]|uniref:DUF4817 domain-containing protein n=1 Tax=Periplaneta americana TaxID=6978 RepID=A0ABQ8TH08_PERAM|nr:hypothetical protein ANN_07008 [Periplaneta americana]